MIILAMRKNKYYKENKKILNEHKTQCVICGESAKCCLEFHHIGEKLFNVQKEEPKLAVQPISKLNLPPIITQPDATAITKPILPIQLNR